MIGQQLTPLLLIIFNSFGNCSSFLLPNGIRHIEKELKEIFFPNIWRHLARNPLPQKIYWTQFQPETLHKISQKTYKVKIIILVFFEVLGSLSLHIILSGKRQTIKILINPPYLFSLWLLVHYQDLENAIRLLLWTCMLSGVIFQLPPIHM